MSLVICGSSGSGKTASLKYLANLLDPEDVHVYDHASSSVGSELSGIRRSSILVVDDADCLPRDQLSALVGIASRRERRMFVSYGPVAETPPDLVRLLPVIDMDAHQCWDSSGRIAECASSLNVEVGTYDLERLCHTSTMGIACQSIKYKALSGEWPSCEIQRVVDEFINAVQDGGAHPSVLVKAVSEGYPLGDVADELQKAIEGTHWPLEAKALSNSRILESFARDRAGMWDETEATSLFIDIRNILESC